MHGESFPEHHGDSEEPREMSWTEQDAFFRDMKAQMIKSYRDHPKIGPAIKAHLERVARETEATAGTDSTDQYAEKEKRDFREFLEIMAKHMSMLDVDMISGRHAEALTGLVKEMEKQEFIAWMTAAMGDIAVDHYRSDEPPEGETT